MNSSAPNIINELEPSDRLKILLVDDVSANIMVLRAVLRNENIDIYEALSGNEALSLMLRHRFALMLLDVRMPDMSGFELATLIRSQEEARDTPIIFVSGIDRDDAVEFEGYEAGAVDFVFKPIRASILRQKVRTFLTQADKQVVLEKKNKKLLEKRREFELFRAKHFSDEKMAAVSRMASGIAHEVNSPLAVIATSLSFLLPLVKAEGDNDDLEGLQEAKESVESIARILSRLRMFAQDQSDDFGTPERSEFGRLLQKQVGHFQDENPEVVFNVDVDDEVVLFGAVQGCGQIGVELLSNAVRAKSAKATGSIAVSLYQDSHHVHLVVSDDGQGMSEEIRAHLFEPFFTTKEEWTSTGLGLTAIFGVMQEMHGTIAVESAPGRGTVVSVTFPVAGEEFLRNATKDLDF
ncbi:MAG: hybrid sensor histidine kinase/response regulator [Deltaproteobacteria bacterium]|nr:hybrid sensor histidine kinase/response regulator [Deltaproteobacteria bacterium]